MIEPLQRPRVAKKPIKVWKILEKGNISPFWTFTYRANKTYKSELQVLSWVRIEKGFHTFTNIKDAIRELEYAGYLNPKVVEMYIPVGATYYKGIWNGAYCYASSQIETKSLRAKIRRPFEDY